MNRGGEVQPLTRLADRRLNRELHPIVSCGPLVFGVRPCFPGNTCGHHGRLPPNVAPPIPPVRTTTPKRWADPGIRGKSPQGPTALATRHRSLLSSSQGLRPLPRRVRLALQLRRRRAPFAGSGSRQQPTWSIIWSSLSLSVSYPSGGDPARIQSRVSFIHSR